MAGPVFIHCILGPKHLVCFYSGSSSFSSRTFCYIISLILFSPIHFLIFLFVELVVFGCLSPSLLLWFTCFFVLIFHCLGFLLYIMLNIFFSCWASLPREGNPGRCKCYYKHSGMGAGLLLISINSFHFHCAHTCLLRYPQAIVLVEFL